MSTNIEPMVNSLMKNTTSANLINNLDMNLINPYGVDVHKHTLNPNINHREEHDKIKKDSEKKENLMNKINGMRNMLGKKIDRITHIPIVPEKVVEGISDREKNLREEKVQNYHRSEEGNDPMNIFSNMGNIQEIIKNKTLNELQHIKESPLDIPGKRSSEPHRTLFPFHARNVNRPPPPPHRPVIHHNVFDPFTKIPDHPFNFDFMKFKQNNKFSK
jgi:hypothetical protein